MINQRHVLKCLIKKIVLKIDVNKLKLKKNSDRSYKVQTIDLFQSSENRKQTKTIIMILEIDE